MIVTAALLLELLSAAQYYFTRLLMEEELEKRAEIELTMKAILIKSTLNSAEDILKNHLWDIRENLSHPDSVYEALERIIVLSRSVQGSVMGFVPNYYPSKGELFEPYVQKVNDSIVKSQIAGPDHDYTKSHPFMDAINTNQALWRGPYKDHTGENTSIISFTMPVYDKSNKLAGVPGVDVSVKWLTDTIDKRHIYPSSFVLLLTEDGKPIIRPSEDRVSEKTTERVINLVNDSTFANQKSHSERSTVVHFNIDHRDATIFYANMKGVPHWKIAVVCYDDEVYASLKQLRILLLLLMLVAFGLLLFMVYHFARNEKNLQKKTLEENRITNELSIASGIQQALLPVNEEHLSYFNEVAVEGRLIPAKAVGGDLYNAFVRDGKLFFCIGDVSGKGIPSALVMAITQALFRNIASRENDPAHIMRQLNEAAARNNKTNYFVTLFIGVLDLPTGHLRYCNAGHETPFLIEPQASGPEHPDDHKEGGAHRVTLLDAKPNLPIGLFSDFVYEKQRIVMQPGATLFLYTDGLTEARNARNKMLSREHVKQMIADSNTTSPKKLVETVIAQTTLFTENAEPSDDLTLLAISYTPKEGHLILDEALTLVNDVKEVEALGTFVKQVMEQLGIGKPLSYQLRLALEEAVVNVMEYAYPAGTTGNVNIHVTSDGQRLTFIITDTGIPFNPTEASTADTSLSAEERPVGGLGIFLVRELMDSINYVRIDGKNVLTLSKKIEKQELKTEQ